MTEFCNTFHTSMTKAQPRPWGTPRFQRAGSDPRTGRGTRRGTPILTPLLDVYRSRGWERQRNQQAGKTKVTTNSVAEATRAVVLLLALRSPRRPARQPPAEWKGSIFGLTPGSAPCVHPTKRKKGASRGPRLRSLHPGLRLCRPAGWTLEAQVIAQSGARTRGTEQKPHISQNQGYVGHGISGPPAREAPRHAADV